MVSYVNVSPGIGVIGMAFLMLQELFGGSLVGIAKKFGELDKTQLAAIATVAAGFTALLSLFNIGGRFFWASLSDEMGRKTTSTVFFVLCGLMCASAPGSAGVGFMVLVVGAFSVILSMYGGGFAAVPAYLADLFGTQIVGAIHGRLLAAWATAGVLGPVVANYMREYQLGLGNRREEVYKKTMYILVGPLVVSWVCNLLVKPLDAKWLMNDAELAAEKKLAHEKMAASEVGSSTGTSTVSAVLMACAWAAVGLQLARGVYRTL